MYFKNDKIISQASFGWRNEIFDKEKAIVVLVLLNVVLIL